MSNPNQVRTAIPDENTTVTSLDIMGNTKAIVWLFVLIGFLVLCCATSFAPKNTMNFAASSLLTGIENEKFTLRANWQHFSPLSSFFILWLDPITSFSTNLNFDLNYISNIRFFDEKRNLIRNLTVNETKSISCAHYVCPEITLYENSIVDFYMVSASLQVQTSEPTLHGIKLVPLALHPGVSLSAFVLISLLTVMISLILFICVPCRMRPSKPDQWATLILALFLTLVDGPWLVLKYYTSNIFTQVFDVGPEIFHIVFIIILTYIIAAKTADMPHRIFSSYIIRGAIFVGLFILMVLQFCITKMMPLHTLSLYKDNSFLTIPAICIFAFFHVGILVLLVYGVLSLQIENLFVLILTAFSVLILELIDITITAIRFSIPRKSIGSSFAGDVFYILMANVITGFFLLTGLPVGIASELIPNNTLGTLDDDDE